jgi:hypothetical protein
MIEICELIENGTRTLIEEKGLEAGDYNFHIIVNKEIPIVSPFATLCGYPLIHNG